MSVHDIAGNAGLAVSPSLLARVWRAARRHPSLAIGSALLLILIFVAVAAPWLGTVDPADLSPARRNRDLFAGAMQVEDNPLPR